MNRRLTRFIEKAQECSICYSPVEFQGQVDSCSHIFCFNCIEKWAKTQNSCPICKMKFSKICRVNHRVVYGQLKESKTIVVDDRSQSAAPDSISVIESANLMIDEALNTLLIELQDSGRGNIDSRTLRRISSSLSLD